MLIERCITPSQKKIVCGSVKLIRFMIPATHEKRATNTFNGTILNLLYPNLKINPKSYVCIFLNKRVVVFKQSNFVEKFSVRLVIRLWLNTCDVTVSVSCHSSGFRALFGISAYPTRCSSKVRTMVF